MTTTTITDVPLSSLRRQNLHIWRHLLTLSVALIVILFSLPLHAQPSYVLGTGESTNDAEYPAPYGNRFNGARHQILIHASELLNQGASAGYITSLGFNVDDPNGSADLANFTIKLKATNATAVTNTFDASGWATVYSNASQGVSSGWNMHSFNNAFYWNGSSNLLVEVCFNNDNYTANAYMYYTETEYASVVYYHEDGSGVCSNTAVTDVSNARPDMRFVIEQPMRYAYSDKQQITDVVAPGSENIPVVRLEVVVNGTYNPLDITEFSFTTEGTAQSGDLTNARVFYTEGSDEFNTDNQFGRDVNNPHGAFTVTGSQQLSEGSNYFWLTYDVASEAKPFSSVDADVQMFNVNGDAETPTNGNVDGARTVWPYCESTADSKRDTYIGEVTLGEMVNTSPAKEEDEGAAYSNYTNNAPATLMLSNEIPISVTKRSTRSNYDAWINVFIDWNQDGVFDETTERVFSTFAQGDDEEGEEELLPALYSGSIVVPDDAVVGLTGMRVIIKEDGDESDSPCGVYDWGETEDYVVNVVRPATLEAVERLAFGNVGSERRLTLELTNSSSVEELNVTRWVINGAGQDSYRVYIPGTTTAFPSSFTLQPNESITAEVAFGNSAYSLAGAQPATLVFRHKGENDPTRVLLRGSFASLMASDNGSDLLAPDATLEVGTVEVNADNGLTLATKTFTLASDETAMKTPLLTDGYTITGPDAALFSISSLPAGISNSAAVISVALNGQDATPGAKEATLTINHSGANGPAIVIHLTGRVGRAVLQVPSLVNLQPVALGSTYASTYDNITLIPLTQAGTTPVEINGNPVLTGSGASMMEIVSNTGNYYIKGKYDDANNVVPVNNLEFSSTWASPSSGSPLVVTDVQPWLVAVRMKAPSFSAVLGSYSANIVFADGLGNGFTNAVNEADVALAGEVVNDVTTTPFNPQQLAFGAVPVGSWVNKTLTLRNQSGAAGQVTMIITGSDFGFDNGAQSLTVNLPATNSSVNIQVRFSPTSSGAANGAITATGVISGSIALSGSGQAANPGNLQVFIDGQPLNSTFDFGNVAVGQIGTRTITVVNNNVGPVSVASIGRSGDNATQFTVGTASSMVIEGNGGSISFPLNFIPTSVSSPAKAATITIYNSTGVPKAFNVRGTAVMNGGSTISVALAPASHNFGNQTGTYAFTLTNNGSAAVTLDGALVLGSSNFMVLDAATSFPRTIAAGATTTITVKFDATQGTNGLRSASLLAVTPGVTPYPTASLTGTVGSGVLGGNGVQALTGPGNANGVLSIAGNYPNPFSSETTVRFSLTEEAPVVVRIYNEAGTEVQTLRLGMQRTGEQSLRVQSQNLSSGTYYYVVEAGDNRAGGVMVIVK